MLDYLAARQHFRYGDRRGALAWLDAADRHGLAGTTRELAVAASVLRGSALFFLGNYGAARAAFSALAGAATAREADRELAADWVARCDFASRQRTRS